MKWLKHLTEKFIKPKEETLLVPSENKSLPSNTHPKFVSKGEERKGIVTYKFNTSQRRQILDMIAHCMTIREIKQAVKEQMNMEISHEQIHNYKSGPKWKGYIQREREAYLASLDEVPGFNDKIRLMRSDGIYDKAIEEGDLKVALSAVEHQRREVKDNSANQAPVSFVFQQFNKLTDAELTDRYNQALVKIAKHKQKVLTIQVEPNGTSGIQDEAGK